MLMVLEHTPPLKIPDLDLQEPIVVAVHHREDAAFGPDQDSGMHAPSLREFQETPIILVER